jgi:hypothetical protein
METLGNQNQPKSALKYYCVVCDYGTSKKCNYNTHIISTKHYKNTNMETNWKQNQPNQLNQVKISKESQYTCNDCCKYFKNRSGLWKHKKKCHIVANKNDTDKKEEMMNDKELIQYLLKENSEFKQLMIEQNKHMIELAKNSGHHNNNTTNNNQQFNLNFYLNETCKNAMNITDFVSQLNVSVKDLEETGRLGYAEGISKIFINGLKQISVSDRPIHCSDSKRETLYIKDNNEWNKETENKVILTNAIKHVANKNIKQISEWTKIHPDYKDSKTKDNDRYLKIVSESMCGITEEDSKKNYSKIIKNIIKETLIDKTLDNK